MSTPIDIFYHVYSQMNSQLQVPCSHLRISAKATALVFTFLYHQKPTKIMGIQRSRQAENTNSKSLELLLLSF